MPDKAIEEMNQDELDSALLRSAADLPGDYYPVDDLLEAGADTAARDSSGWTPLHAAGHPDITRELLQAGADTGHTDGMGRTPLHYADTQEQAEILLDAGADPHATDDHGNTPAQYQETVLGEPLIDREETPVHSFVAVNGYDTGNGRDVAAVWWQSGDCYLVFAKYPAADWGDKEAVSVGAMGGDNAKEAALLTANGGPDSLDDNEPVKTMAELAQGSNVDLDTLRAGLAAGKEHGLPEGLMEALDGASRDQPESSHTQEPNHQSQPASRRPGPRRREQGTEQGL